MTSHTFTTTLFSFPFLLQSLAWFFATHGYAAALGLRLDPSTKPWSSVKLHNPAIIKTVNLEPTSKTVGRLKNHWENSYTGHSV
jgi:hypothetical protein